MSRCHTFNGLSHLLRGFEYRINVLGTWSRVIKQANTDTTVQTHLPFNIHCPQLIIQFRQVLCNLFFIHVSAKNFVRVRDEWSCQSAGVESSVPTKSGIHGGNVPPPLRVLILVTPWS